jgi:hypothetical protein
MLRDRGQDGVHQAAEVVAAQLERGKRMIG